ncbi:MAG: TRAP transporter fused permease subunit [Vicinamibacterales bacterium]
MPRVLCFLLSALSLVWVLVVISPQIYRPLMLLIGVWAILRAKPLPGRRGAVIDLAWVVAALWGLGWPLAAGDAFLYRAANPTPQDLVAGVLAIAVVLEAARRTTGWILPVSAAVFLVYAVAGPGLQAIGLTGLAHRGYDLSRLVGNLYMTLEGLYGVPLDVAVTYIVLFSLYGAVLEHSGAGAFFLDFSMSVSRGHSARAAGRSVTLAGFLLGTVSGSGVATTVTLGSVAWPVLRRTGYKPDTAGAMLAASGIGAILSPPTLGAAAFLIAEYLRISYLQVLVMATVPTLLYYQSILLMIEGEAGERPVGSDAAAGPTDRRPAGSAPDAAVAAAEATVPAAPASPAPIARRLYHFTSLVIVAVLMALGFTAFRAVFWATVAAVGLSFLGPAGERLGPRRLAGALTAGGEDVLSVLATTAVAGIIVGVVTLTGLGLKAAGLIVGLAGGSLLLTVIYSALAVWILGLAVPVTASYIISAVMVVPALTTVGVAPVAAHMFIFYYAVLSEVSPPTALAPFAAAALTGGSPFRTMIRTWRFSLPAFLVPFAFTLDPRGLGLLLQADALTTAVTTLTAAAGVAALAMSLGGWRMPHARMPERVLTGAGGLLLFHPAVVATVAGAALTVAGLGLHARRPATS